MATSVRPVCSIIPPYVLRKLLESDDRDVREAAFNTLLTTAQLRGGRMARASFAGAVRAVGAGRRTIFDCRQSEFLTSAVLKRSEDGPASGDDSVNRAFDGLGTTRQFYEDVFERNSLDDRGMRLDAYVHYGRKVNNAYFDGQQMLFGDGDGVNFTDLTRSLDVIAHELTHGVVQFTAGLEYHKEPGALNESVADVFGSLVKQWSLNQSADEADWLIGPDVFTPGIDMDALRSMKAPGTAFDGDPQPDHMDRFVHMPDTEEGDNGAVHYNSGIPNKAFFLTATALGGFAWGTPGVIWYESLKASTETTRFQEFADTTFAKAGELFGTGGPEQLAVSDAWRQVGIRIRGLPVGPAGLRPRSLSSGPGGSTNGTGDVAAALASLTAELKGLSKEVAALKTKK